MPKFKTVNIITTSFYPEKSANANRINSLVNVLSKQHRINVIYLLEAGKDYNCGATTSKFSENKNVSFYPVLQSKHNGANFAARILHELWHSVKLNYHNLRVNSDVSIFSIPYLMLLPVTNVFNFFYKRRKILEIRDIIWLYLEFAGKNVPSAITKIAESMSLLFVSKFDFVVTATQSQLDYLIAKGLPSDRMSVIPNGIDKFKFEQLINIKTNKKSSIIVTYAGTIGFAQGIGTLLEAANILRNNSNYYFCIAGRGNDLVKILSAIELNALSNVSYLGELNWRDMLRLYSRSGILYAQLIDSPSLSTAQPSKIFEYASTGLPIIFGGSGESEKVLSKLENCKCVKPNDPGALVAAIEGLSFSCASHYNKEVIKMNYLRENLLGEYLSIID